MRGCRPPHITEDGASARHGECGERRRRRDHREGATRSRRGGGEGGAAVNDPPLRSPSTRRRRGSTPREGRAGWRRRHASVSRGRRRRPDAREHRELNLLGEKTVRSRRRTHGHGGDSSAAVSNFERRGNCGKRAQLARCRSR